MTRFTKFLPNRENSLNKLIAIIFLVVCTARPAIAQDQSSYHGFWWNEDRSGIVELMPADDGIKGVTRWGKTPDTDRHNPDPNLRNRNLKGITFLWGFTYEPKKNRWKGGKVYDPNNGKTYDAKMSLEDDGNTLKMRGYVGISLLGRTAKFERVKATDFPVDFAH